MTARYRLAPDAPSGLSPAGEYEREHPAQRSTEGPEAHADRWCSGPRSSLYQGGTAVRVVAELAHACPTSLGVVAVMRIDSDAAKKSTNSRDSALPSADNRREQGGSAGPGSR